MSGKTRVAIALPCFALGGAQRMAYELSKSIDKDLFEVLVVCYEESPAKGMEESLAAEDVEVRHVGPYGKIRAAALRDISAVLSKFAPDVVHAHLGGAQAVLPWCFMKRVPLVVTLHTTMPHALNPLVEKIVRLDRRGRHIWLVAVSEGTRAQATRHFGFGEGRILEVDNGIDLSEYRTAKPGDPVVFVNVGTQNANKNQRMLLEAFKEVSSANPDSRLVLLGDGPEHEGLVDAAAGDGRIVLPGAVMDVAAWLSLANVYVQCSYREAMPMAIIEAIASGLPVIATNVGGVSDVVRDGREGYLIEPGSKAALVEAMGRFCDPTLRARASAAAFDRADAFSSSAMARNYERIYLEAVSGR